MPRHKLIRAETDLALEAIWDRNPDDLPQACGGGLNRQALATPVTVSHRLVAELLPPAP